VNRFFWPAFVVAALLCGTATQIASWRAIGTPSTKPPIPIPGQQYVSATRDGQTDQSLFYFDILGFGQRINAADVIVAGSSHAEFGISAATLGGKKGFNIALGGSESLNFAVKLLLRYRHDPSLLVLDPFATDVAGPSTEAVRVLASTRGESYLRVFNIWANFARDLMLQGFLPRVTLAKSSLIFENPIGTTIMRDWQTADVTAVYSASGEVFADPAKGHPIADGPKWKSLVAPLPSDVAALRGMAKTILVTTVPHPGAEDWIARKLADQIGAKFVPLDASNLLLWDYHHVNAVSRGRVTSELQAALRP
jgi:hypothetical protein